MVLLPSLLDHIIIRQTESGLSHSSLCPVLTITLHCLFDQSAMYSQRSRIYTHNIPKTSHTRVVISQRSNGIQKNAERQCACNAIIILATATQWHYQQMHWDCKEWRAMKCTLSIHKTNVFPWCYDKSAVKSSYNMVATRIHLSSTANFCASLSGCLRLVW